MITHTPKGCLGFHNLGLHHRSGGSLLAVLLCNMPAARVYAASVAGSANILPALSPSILLVQPARSSLPAGTTLYVRLDTAVSTQSSHLHAPITAHVVREVAGTQGVAIPLGALVRGTIAKLIPTSDPADRARLLLQFNQLEIIGHATIAFTGRVTEVENARESVLADGTIQGVLANEVPLTLFNSAMSKLGKLGEDAQTKLGKPNTLIELPANTDLELTLDNPLELRESYPNAIPDEIPPEIRAAIDKLLIDAPGRVAGQNGTPGDALNLIFVGSEDEIRKGFDQAGWSIPERATHGSISQTIRASIENLGYGNAPISDLYLYGRIQQLAFEKMFNTFAKRHHLRIWRAPAKAPEGRDIWLAAGTHDNGLDLRPREGVMSHAIDPRIDLERDKVGADLMATGNVSAEQLVTRPDPLSAGLTATGGKWKTDGRLRVIVFKPL